MRRKIGSKGFTLVELLVGVLILAVIIVPLTTAFLTSQKTSNKAKEIRSQTLTATNIIEAYKATDIGALLDAFKMAPGTGVLGSTGLVSSITAYNSETGAYDEVTATSKEASDGAAYKIYLKGVSAGTKMYDAVLSLDASAAYAQTNSAEIVDYKPMDAVYIQPDPLKEAENNPDIIAAKTFASQAQIDSGKTVSHEEFVNRMTRNITITVRKIASGSETGIISCRVLFHYETTYTYEVTDMSASPPIVTLITKEYSTDISNDFYSGNYSPDEMGIYGMYFFYYPNAVGQKDTLEILNRDNVVLSVYLIRQSSDDTGYTPVINLRETYVSATEPKHALVHYNNMSIPQYPYKSYTGYPSGNGYNDFWYKTEYFDSILVDTEQKNRLYGMKVELFKHDKSGAGFAASDFLTSFDAASLE
jgi:prepilin-type N-terminal cleavage/methylation domain-containing protein